MIFILMIIHIHVRTDMHNNEKYSLCIVILYHLMSNINVVGSIGNYFAGELVQLYNSALSVT